MRPDFFKLWMIKMDEHHQKLSEDYLTSLKAFSQYLIANPILQRKHPEMYSAVQRFHNQVTMAKKAPNSPATISIDPNWCFVSNSKDCCGPPGETKLYIGGEIRFERKILKYQSVAVTIQFVPEQDVAQRRGYPDLLAGKKYVVRRFHFDFDIDQIHKNDRPIHHLQYGGHLNQAYLSNEEDECKYELFGDMALPRLPILPSDLASIFELFCRQFEAPFKRVVLDTEWKSRVWAFEKIWMRHYCDLLLRELEKGQRTKTHLDHAYYPYAQ